jgi:ABC-type lipoprotein export system ATPase subunit
MKTDPLGSIWRRWDLHLHTPASFDYQDASVNAQRLVDRLIGEGVEVVAITDHHVIDIQLIGEMQELAGDRLTVLPGIELRSQLGGSESVHYIGIFSEDCDLDDVWIKLQSIQVSEADVRKKGDERIFVPFEVGCWKIRELGGIVTVHAGTKTNSIEGLSNADILKQAIKTEYVHRYLHAYEVGKLKDCEGYITKVFPTIGKELPLLICSDNHRIDTYETTCPMWIKADPNFAGLLQLLNEPSGRIYLGDLPPSIYRVKENATKYMDSISFGRTEEAKETERWFEGTIPLNHGLIAIIGNKGSGKSALSDILALLGDTHAGEHFSFLNRKRFLSPKTRLGNMFYSKVTWRSGREISRELHESPDVESPELVKYLPQNYLEAICSELKGSNQTRFYQELMEVIFSHVDEAERVGKETLEDLIDFLTNEKEERIAQILINLASTNVIIEGLEDQCTDEYRKNIEGRLEQRRAELKAHDEAKPQEVKEPEQDPQTQETTKAITADLVGLQKRIDELENLLTAERRELKRAALQIAAADKLASRIENVERLVTTFYKESAEDGKVLGLDVKDIVIFKADRQPILTVKSKAEERSRAAKTSLDANTSGSLAAQHKALTAMAESKRLQLNEPNRRYQNYLQQIALWKKKRDVTLGSADEPDSIVGLEKKLLDVATLPNRLAEQRNVRISLVKEIFYAKEQLLEDYRKLYSPVQVFIDRHPVSKENGGLQFFASIAVDGFVDGSLDMIHQGRKGSFQGDKEGRERLGDIVSSNDFSTEDGLLTFLSTVEDHLKRDKRSANDQPMLLRDQLVQDVLPRDVYDYLYGLSYLKPRFELRWQGKQLDQLSQGERGNLLLVFYLLIDKRDTPLIIDQPEENLDNQTIVTMLVPAIKNAKQRRQIILVTHNPNLAVVCDAEQIIHASIDKPNGNRISYTSGSIENPIITRLIIDVLEGTKPAFDLRDAKYDILERPI